MALARSVLTGQQERAYDLAKRLMESEAAARERHAAQLEQQARQRKGGTQR